MRKRFTQAESPVRVRAGRVLRQARRDRGLSQADIARLAGVNQKCVSSLETGTSDHNFEVVARYLGVGDADRLGGS